MIDLDQSQVFVRRGFGKGRDTVSVHEKNYSVFLDSPKSLLSSSLVREINSAGKRRDVGVHENEKK